MSDLYYLFVDPKEEHHNRVLDVIGSIRSSDPDWVIFMNQRPQEWLTEIQVARQERNLFYKRFVILVELLHNRWFGEKLLAQETPFVKENYTLILQTQLHRHIVGLKFDGEKFVGEEFSHERHVVAFVSLLAGIYMKL